MKKPSSSTMFRTRKRALALASTGIEAPTEERLRRDAVELVEERDGDGWPVAHYRVGDIIGKLVRGGLLESHCAAAADRFRRDFSMARLNPLSAIDLSRQFGQGHREVVVDRIEDARRRLGLVLERLGGTSSPAGSIIWCVIGEERSLRDWVQHQAWGGRNLRHEIATGILVGALSALNACYDDARQVARHG